MSKNSKGNKETVFKTKGFVISCEATVDQCFDKPWKVSRRISKKDIKTGNSVDTNQVIAEIIYHEPDEYKCVTAEYNFDENLTAQECKEILGILNETIASKENVVFVRVFADVKNEKLKEALTALIFVTDKLDENYLLWEVPLTNWMAVYMCLGMSIGMSVGLALHTMSFVLGMSLGMLFGIAIGVSFDNSEKKKREKLRNERLGIMTPDEAD